MQVMGSCKIMRAFDLVLAMLGVFAVVACGPSAPEQQLGSVGDVPENVSVPATEAPFVLP